MKDLGIQTKLQKILVFENLAEQLTEAVNLLKNNDIVAFPTETVYGLGANALSADAVKKIFDAKGRPSDNPIIVHVSSIEMFEQLVDKRFFDSRIKRLQQKFWPGPLTLIIKKSALVPYVTTGGLETVAIRMPSHPIALALIKLSSLPIAAPSANLSGKPSPTTAEDVLDDMNGRIPLIIDGGNAEIGLESTVLDISDNKKTPIILRPGKITKQQLEDCLGEEIVVYENQNTSENDNRHQPKSPGMKYRHYAPNAELIVVASIDEFVATYKQYYLNKLKIGLIFDKQYSKAIKELYNADLDSILFSYSSKDELGANLYQKLREMDKSAVDIIIVQFNGSNGLGLAILNRLTKASSKK